MKPYKQQGSKSEQIKIMFDNIAPTYDLLNRILSFGIDRLWRAKLSRRIKKSQPQTIVDIATGTGDLAIELAGKCPQAKIVGVDLSPKMIEIARKKVESKKMTNRIELLVEDVQKIDFEDGGFDVATCAFGVRNFQDVSSGLSSMARVIKSGGKIAILEFSTPKNKIFGSVYGLYSHKFLPWLGGLLSRDREAYVYLPESVDEFFSPKQFIEIMKQAGFENITTQCLMMGVAYIYYGDKKID